MLLLLLSASLAVEIPLQTAVEIPKAVLSRAVAEADRLFDAGGIRFDWRISDGEPSAEAPAAIVLLARPAQPVISGCSRNLHDHRLGRADLGARRVTLWTEQIARAVKGSWDRKDAPRVDEGSLGTALGRVLAHELGHLFLRLDGHRESGLMKPSFTQRALVGKSDRSIRLSGEDLERVREAITRLQVRESAGPGRPLPPRARSAGKRAERRAERASDQCRNVFAIDTSSALCSGVRMEASSVRDELTSLEARSKSST